MSVPDHQIDSPDSYVTPEEVEGYWAVDQEIKVVFPVIVGVDPGNSETVFAPLYPINPLPACGHVFPYVQNADYETAFDNVTLADQILDIFNAYIPREETANRWWSLDGDWDGWNLPNSHEKRTRYYLEKYPWWKLWKINKKLEEEKLTPTIDHEESLIMIGKSKASAAYIQHNNNFKRFIEELCPL
jgi:hypothetical protein